jgi:2-oxoglutarate ferredoxin oxidoreductase subunit delta
MPLKGTIEVDEQLCKGCELCVSDCPQHVLALDPAHLFTEGCTGCAVCALVCPEAAISVYREGAKVKPGETGGAA